MQTLQAKLSRSAVQALVAGLALIGLCGMASAQGPGKTAPVVASDEPAGYLVFPKLVVDTQGILASSGGAGIDTVVQLTNTDLTAPHDVQCWYVNANSLCSNDPARVCETNIDCSGGVCEPQWSVGDFHIVLTPGQPVAWRVSAGSGFLPCDPLNPDLPASCGTVPENTNSGNVPPAGADPFRGELKCVETDSGDVPVERNDLKGEATIYRVIDGAGALVDAASYNAIGFQARGEFFVGAPDDILCLGGPLLDPTSANCPMSEYAGCPAVLIVNHFFDGAASPNGSVCSGGTNPGVPCVVGGTECLGGGVCIATTITTNVTLAPCTENLADPAQQLRTTAQMLVYNEFEQRFSSSTMVDCFKDVQLSDLDTRPGIQDNAYSIFAVGVEGTLTGQTRIRGVEGAETDGGHGLIGVAQEYHSRDGSVVSSAAFNLNYFGERQQRDLVRLSVPAPSAALVGLCGICAADADCGAPLLCYDCSQDCPQGAPRRCANQTSLVDCGPGVGMY